MLLLKEGIENRNNKMIISALIKLRNLSKSCVISRQTFKLLVEMIKMPNEKILNYTLSILANCCVKELYKKMFKEFGGVPHVVLIIQTIEHDNIICRACRLIGNLAGNSNLVEEMCSYNVILCLLQQLEKCENQFPQTLQMIFRALKKIFGSKKFKNFTIPHNILPVLKNCLNYPDHYVLFSTVQILSVLTDGKHFKQNVLKADKELFLKLIELAKNKDLNNQVVCLLSNLIYFQTSTIWGYLEGSSIADIFIEYFQNNKRKKKYTYKAFCRLCTVGAIRCKVRLSGLLLKLIDSSDSENSDSILDIFCLFQYDLDSIKVCSQNPKFISLLIDNITLPASVQLLAVLSRLDPPIKELLMDHNLQIIIRNKNCYGVLKNITKTGQFLKPLLLSGRVWEIEKAGCSMDDVCNPELLEYQIMQLLSTSDKKCIENVSLAVPFLLKPLYFNQLHKIMVRYNMMTTILNMLQANATDEKILATIIRLIRNFKFNYHEPQNFFRDFVGGELLVMRTNLLKNTNEETIEDKSSDTEEVILELDNGNCVNVHKSTLCRASPVLNSMLNGHFLEAGQKRIRLRKCTEKGILFLVNLLNGKSIDLNWDIEVYLELLHLTDRFLLPELNSTLTDKLQVDVKCCTQVYKWYRGAGYTENNFKIGQKVYEFIFASSQNLWSVMKDESCRIHLVCEISQYLLGSINEVSLT